MERLVLARDEMARRLGGVLWLVVVAERMGRRLDGGGFGFLGFLRRDHH